MTKWGTKITLTCQVCRELFEVSPGLWFKKCCSDLCARKIPRHTQPHSELSKAIMSSLKKGKHMSPDTEYKRNPETSERDYVRNSSDYSKWRKRVFDRDSYTCQHCGQVGGKLQADHIKTFYLYPELRLDIDNGRTLCEDCHKKTATYKMNQHTQNKLHREGLL